MIGKFYGCRQKLKLKSVDTAQPITTNLKVSRFNSKLDFDPRFRFFLKFHLN